LQFLGDSQGETAFQPTEPCWQLSKMLGVLTANTAFEPKIHAGTGAEQRKI
jgi:hypothetical protein